MNASHKAIFLSYASQDAEAARRICDALQAFLLPVVIDPLVDVHARVPDKFREVQ